MPKTRRVPFRGQSPPEESLFFPACTKKKILAALGNDHDSGGFFSILQEAHREITSRSSAAPEATADASARRALRAHPIPQTATTAPPPRTATHSAPSQTLPALFLQIQRS